MVKKKIGDMCCLEMRPFMYEVSVKDGIWYHFRGCHATVFFSSFYLFDVLYFDTLMWFHLKVVFVMSCDTSKDDHTLCDILWFFSGYDGIWIWLMWYHSLSHMHVRYYTILEVMWHHVILVNSLVIRLCIMQFTVRCPTITSRSA
jgi:hypothetical protein